MSGDKPLVVAQHAPADNPPAPQDGASGPKTAREILSQEFAQLGSVWSPQRTDLGAPGRPVPAGAENTVGGLPNLTLVKENSVQVQNPHPGMTPGLGSGAIVNMPHDHGAPTKVILTAAHMVQGHVVGDTVTIVSDKTGQTYQTQILAINSGTDLAELALPQQLAGAPGFQLAPGDAHPNDHIFSVAHPAGSTNLEVSPGIAGPNFPASNQPRPDAVLPNTTLQGAFMVIAQGSSGGEVLDSRGRLVGLADATWGVTTVPSPSGAAAVGYNTTIVPVSTIKRSFR